MAITTLGAGMNPSIETFTEIELAKSELADAITLFFEDKHKIAYYLSAYASHEILRTIAKKVGINSIFIDDFPNVIDIEAFDNAISKRFGTQYTRLKRKGVKAKVKFFIEHDYSKLKHGSGSKNATVTIHWDTAELIMVDSLELLKGIGENLSAEHIVFMLWISKRMPTLYTNQKVVDSFRSFENLYGGVNNKRECLKLIRNIKESTFGKLLHH